MRSSILFFAAAIVLGSGAAVAQTSGSTPTIPGKPGASVSDTTIQHAGKALKDVVAIKQRYAQQMKSAGNAGDQQKLAQRAQAESTQAVQAQGLSVTQYNDVIELARSDPGVKERLLSAAGQ